MFYFKNKIYVFIVVFILEAGLFFGNIHTIFPSLPKKDFGQTEKFDKENIEYMKKMEKALEGSISYTFFSIVFALGLLGLFLLGIIFCIIYIVFCFLQKTIFHIERSMLTQSLAFSFGDLIRFLVIYLFLHICLKFVVFCIFVFSIKFGLDYECFKGTAIYLSLVFTDILPIWFIIKFLKNKYNQGIGFLGIDFIQPVKKAIYGLCVYISGFPFVLSALCVSFIVAEFFKYESAPHPIVPMVLQESSSVDISFLMIFACIIGPISEEILFRGILYPLMKKRAGVFVSAILSSAFFAFLHFDPVAFLGVFFIGLLLVYLYEKTGSLMPCFFVHILHNSAMMFFLLFLKKYSL